MRTRALVVGLLIAAATYSGARRARDLQAASQDTLQTIVRGVRYWEDSIRTLRGRFVIDISLHRSVAPTRRLHSPLYVALAMDGRKVREQLLGPDGRTPGDIRVLAPPRGYYYDARYKTANEVELARHAGRGWAGEPVAVVQYLRLGFKYSLTPGVRRLSDEIREAEARVAGRDKVGGIECWRLEAGKRRPGEVKHVWWIAPTRDYLCLKETQYYDARPDGPRLEIVADQLRKFPGGIWLPGRVTGLNYGDPKRPGGKQPDVARLQALSLQVNMPIAESTFARPKYPSGTLITGPKGYRVP